MITLAMNYYHFLRCQPLQCPRIAQPDQGLDYQQPAGW
jgi:hypothetical protein